MTVKHRQFTLEIAMHPLSGRMSKVRFERRPITRPQIHIRLCHGCHTGQRQLFRQAALMRSEHALASTPRLR